MADALSRVISHAQSDWLERKTTKQRSPICFLNREHETNIQLSLNIVQLSFIDLERGEFCEILPSMMPQGKYYHS
jgi:hypothetical protein